MPTTSEKLEAYKDVLDDSGVSLQYDSIKDKTFRYLFYKKSAFKHFLKIFEKEKLQEVKYQNWDYNEALLTKNPVHDDSVGDHFENVFEKAIT